MDDLELVLCCYFVKNRIGVKITRHKTLIRGRPYYSFDDGSKLALQKHLVTSDSYLWTDGQTGATITIKKKLGREIWVLSDGALVSQNSRLCGAEPSWTISTRNASIITISKRISGNSIGYVSSWNIVLTSRSGWTSEYWESTRVRRKERRYDSGPSLLGGILFRTAVVLLVAGYSYYRVKKWLNRDARRRR